MPVFISHSAEDKAIYSTLCLAFDGSRIERWDHTKMTPGASLSDQLRNAILECEICVFIATRRSIESPWCLAEIGAFWGSGKTVLVFLTDASLTDSVLPPQFKGNLMVNDAGELIGAVGSAIEKSSISRARDNEKSEKFPWLERPFFYGPKTVFRTGNIFQDFQLLPKGSSGNVNAVQWMWADSSVASEISATVSRNECVLRVKFNNTAGAYPCNIAIRGEDEQPLRNAPFKKYLIFAARLSRDNEFPVSVAVRIVNGYGQHWLYGTGGGSYIYKRINSSKEWTTVQIDLSSDNWYKFDSDGNPEGPPVHNFNGINSVVLQLARASDASSYSDGDGSLDIAPLVLLDDQQEYTKFLPRAA